MNYTLRNLLVASVLMIVGILLVTSFIRGERREISRGQERITVYVAAKDIPEGTPADELENGGFLDTKEIAREAAPPQAIGKLSAIKGLVSNDPVYEGEIVSMTAFDRQAGLKPTAQIKGNERLFTLPIPAASDVAGAIRVGDRVDLSASIGDGTDTTRVILGRDIEVMETPESLQPEGTEVEAAAPEAEGDKKLYVLKATDEEAQYILYGLSAADDYGVSMMLRSSSGDTQSRVPPISNVDAKVD